MFFYRIALRFGYKASRNFIGMQIVLCVLLIYFHGVMVLGSKNTLIFVGTSITVGTLTELVGTKTGWIFGQYHYAEKFGPKLFGVVPVFVSLMWCIITYLGFWIAKLLLLPRAGQGIIYQGVFVISAAFIVTLWDLVADPMVVDEKGRNWWIWEKGGKYYGVPFTNFIGWFVTAALIYTILFVLINDLTAVSNVSPWIEYLPAFGYCVVTGVFARACLKRILMVPGIIGLLVTVVCFVVGIINIIQ